MLASVRQQAAESSNDDIKASQLLTWCTRCAWNTWLDVNMTSAYVKP